MTLHYDSLPINEDILLDLPYREGIGAVTQDVAKPHHPIVMVDTPTWTERVSGLTALTLNGTSEYLYSLAADTADLDFTSGDYSLAIWVNWSVEEYSQIVMGRYELFVSGWELYLYSGTTDILTLRQHHAAGATTRTGVYSAGWTPGTMWFLGLSRTGTTAQMYRNGVAVATLGDVLIDPETCDKNLYIGKRYFGLSNFLKGEHWRPRIWGRALSAAEWEQEYERTRGWFA